MPSAMVKMAVRANPGLLSRLRIAYERSLPIMVVLRHRWPVDRKRYSGGCGTRPGTTEAGQRVGKATAGHSDEYPAAWSSRGPGEAWRSLLANDRRSALPATGHDGNHNDQHQGKADNREPLRTGVPGRAALRSTHVDLDGRVLHHHRHGRGARNEHQA